MGRIVSTLLFVVATVYVSAQPISRPTQFIEQPFDVEIYDATITSRIPATKQISGICTIVFTWKQALSTPTFPVHLRGLEIDSVISHDTNVEFTEAGTPTQDTFHYRVALGRAVTAGQRDSITVYYSGKATTEGGSSAWGGVWFEGLTLYTLGVGFNNNYVSATQHWLACYDHPSDKAAFRLSFIIPRSQTVASIGTRISTTPISGDTLVKHTWYESHPTATYLATFAIGAYQELSFTGTTVPIVAYSRATDTTSSRITYSRIDDMTNLFTSLYGPYPFDKVGYVNTSRGAMEHQTMISMPVSSVNQRDSNNSTAAHELAHMWFGDLVSPLDFRYAWLTESFATYSEAAWLESHSGFEAYLESMQKGAQSYITGIARREGVMPLHDYPRTPPSSNYPETIYRKGSNVLAMLRYLVGGEQFYATLREYLGSHRYGNATTEDMKEAFRPVLGANTDAFFNEWIYGKGWPMLAVDMRPSHSSWIVTIRQVQRTQHPDWPLFTTLPLNVLYTDAVTGVTVDTVLMIDKEEVSFEINSPQNLGINAGSKVRSLVEVVSITSVMEPRIASEYIQVLPNPAWDSATLRRVNANEEARIDIVDTRGKVHFSAIILEGETDLALSLKGWPAGAYTVRLLSETAMAAAPLVLSP